MSQLSERDKVKKKRNKILLIIGVLIAVVWILYELEITGRKITSSLNMLLFALMFGFISKLFLDLEKPAPYFLYESKIARKIIGIFSLVVSLFFLFLSIYSLFKV